MNWTARTILLLCALALVGCAPAVSTPDAAPDACVTATQTEACVAAYDSICARIIECCGVTPRPSACPGWTTTRECRAELARTSADADCATATGAPVCRSRVDACVAMVPTLACMDVLNGTAHVNCR